MTDLRARLDDLRDRGLYRRTRLISGPQGPRVTVDGRAVLLLCSNNYLGLGRQGWRVRPRRSRCMACGVTHVLLPARLLLRRAHEAAVIGAALAAAARGHGHRRAAREVGVPEDTVRGWLRRAAGRAGQVRELFTRVAAAVSADPVPLEPAGSGLADALAALAAAAVSAAGRWPELLTVSPWEIASAITNATLMAPVMAAGVFNASSLS